LESDKTTPQPADAPNSVTTGVGAGTEELPGSPPVTASGQPPVKREVPSGATPAARVAPGAAKASTTPTASVAKGIPKAAAAKQSPTTLVEAPPDPPINKMRRRIVWATVAGFLATCFMMFLRFFLPRTLTEPSSVFRIGFPSDYSLGVDTKFQQQHRIWVVKNTERLFVIFARCTHLGCTPDWKASENKFKCPCHGSGYDSEGINFEGPAPRPMDRAAVDVDAEGQIVVNTGKLYDWPKGGTNHFNEKGAYIQV
jgi:cytochrome b6-f complex iron-sulfur subunit